MIPNMAIEIDGVEFITTAEAVELAREWGTEIAQESIANAARRKRIDGAKKMWDNPKAPWIFPTGAFEDWVLSERSKGRPKNE